MRIDDAQDRNHQKQRHKFARALPENEPHRVGGGQLGTRKFVHRKDVQDGQVAEQINDNNQAHASDHRARQVTCGVAVFLGEVGSGVPAVVGVENGLQRKYHRTEPTARLGDAAGGGQRLLRRDFLSVGVAKTHKSKQPHSFDKTHHILKLTRQRQPNPVQRGQCRQHRHGQIRLVAHQLRQQQSQVLAHGIDPKAQRRAGTEPAIQPHHEARVVAKGPLRVHVPRPRPRHRST